MAPVIKLEANASSDNLSNLKIHASYNEFDGPRAEFGGSDAGKLNNKNDINAKDTETDHIYFSKIFLMRKDVQV